MKKSILAITAAAALAICASGALIVKNTQNFFLVKGEETYGTFTLDASHNMWSAIGAKTEIESDIGTKGSIKVGGICIKTDVTKKTDTYCSVEFQENTNASVLWISLYVRGMTSLSWKFSEDIDFYIECWQSVPNDISGCSGKLTDNGYFSGSEGTADLAEATNCMQYIVLEFSGDTVGASNFDIISLEAKYSVGNCMNSVAKNPNN